MQHVKEELIKNTDPCKNDAACQMLECKHFSCGSSFTSRTNNQQQSSVGGFIMESCMARHHGQC